MDTEVRLEAFEIDLHHVFVDRAIPAPLALPETIETFEKPHSHWNSVVIEFLVSGCHFKSVLRVFQGLGRAGIQRFRPRGGNQNNRFRG